jgi:hypothetical protein
MSPKLPTRRVCPDDLVAAAKRPLPKPSSSSPCTHKYAHRSNLAGVSRGVLMRSSTRASSLSSLKTDRRDNERSTHSAERAERSRVSGPRRQSLPASVSFENCTPSSSSFFKSVLPGPEQLALYGARRIAHGSKQWKFRLASRKLNKRQFWPIVSSISTNSALVLATRPVTKRSRT